MNSELEEIALALPQAVGALAPGGRLVVISFHSLEDRIVKHFLRDHNDFEALTKRPIEASESETLENPRARSAKLRVGKKLQTSDATSKLEVIV